MNTEELLKDFKGVTEKYFKEIQYKTREKMEQMYELSKNFKQDFHGDIQKIYENTNKISELIETTKEPIKNALQHQLDIASVKALIEQTEKIVKELDDNLLKENDILKEELNIFSELKEMYKEEINKISNILVELSTRDEKENSSIIKYLEEQKTKLEKNLLSFYKRIEWNEKLLHKTGLLIS